MEPIQYEGPERRNYFRYNIIFSPRHGAKLIIEGKTFKVLDFSEGGLRFLKEDQNPLGPCVKAQLIYADGKKKSIEGEIVWELGEEVGLKYI